MNRTALTMAMFTALLQPLTVLGDPPNAKLPPATDVKSTQQVDLRGEWELVLRSRGPVLGLPSDEEATARWIIADKTWTRTVVGIPVMGNYSLDNKQTPHHIDLSGMDDGRPVTAKGVYLLKHNVLILKTSQEGKPRPTTIEFSPDETGVEYFVLVRISSAAENTPFVPLILSEASEMATVSVAKALFEQQDGKYFLACVRVTNKSDREIGVDLRSRQYCVGINQWSATDTAERIIINESREIPVPFTPEEQAKLVAAFHAEKLVRVPVGKHVDYYYPFIGEERSSNRAAVEKLKTKFVILSMDGELRVTNGEQTELLRCGEPGDADVSIPRPVTWHRVPFGGRIVSDDGILVEGTSPDDVEEVRLTPAEPGSG